MQNRRRGNTKQKKCREEEKKETKKKHAAVLGIVAALQEGLVTGRFVTCSSLDGMGWDGTGPDGAVHGIKMGVWECGNESRLVWFDLGRVCLWTFEAFDRFGTRMSGFWGMGMGMGVWFCDEGEGDE